ncbi:MAG TPA: hypothetical protein VGL31_03750 [Xanthobacteraceae bacterium]|jgi:hypothetical protein
MGAAMDARHRVSTWNGCASLAATLLVGFMTAWPHVLVAQSPEAADGAVRVGDLWIYETRNEVTGLPAEGYTEMVAQVSPKEVVVNRTFREPVYRWPQNYIVTYDHDWNVVDRFDWKFKPNDGLGFRAPLSVGKTWQAEFDAQDLQTTRRTYRGTSASKVVGQETITTGAGTFDTFKIDQQARWLDPRDLARIWEFQVVSWYAPQINHWVRQTKLLKFAKRVRYSTSEELADFTRKL